MSKQEKRILPFYCVNCGFECPKIEQLKEHKEYCNLNKMEDKS